MSEEMELITSTQYVMSGSTPDISKVKGGSQVRERVEFDEAVMFSEPTAERRPIIDQEQHISRCNPPKLTLY